MSLNHLFVKCRNSPHQYYHNVHSQINWIAKVKVNSRWIGNIVLCWWVTDWSLWICLFVCLFVFCLGGVQVECVSRPYVTKGTISTNLLPSLLLLLLLCYFICLYFLQRLTLIHSFILCHISHSLAEYQIWHWYSLILNELAVLINAITYDIIHYTVYTFHYFSCLANTIIS